MQFGACLGGDFAFAELCAKAGCDYVEMAAAAVLEPQKSESEWSENRDKLLSLPLPLPVLNLFFAPDIVLVGPDRDLERAADYAEVLLERAKLVGAGIQVFGSGKARTPPEGYDKQKALDELIEVGRRIGPIARKHGIIIAMEHLRQVESTLLSTPDEGLQYVRAVDDPNIRLLIDSYHVEQMNANYEAAVRGADVLVHTHTADGATRSDPFSAQSDLRPFFSKLKEGGYDGRCSLECRYEDRDKDLAANLELLRRQWQEA